MRLANTALNALSGLRATGPHEYSVVGDGGWQSLTSAAGLSWRAVSSNGSVAVDANVPGQIHLDLQAAGVIGDTYFRFNQAANAWVYHDSWTFEVNFTLAPAIAKLVSCGEVWLVFDGIDTLGTIELNIPPPPPSPPPSPRPPTPRLLPIPAVPRRFP